MNAFETESGCRVANTVQYETRERIRRTEFSLRERRLDVRVVFQSQQHGPHIARTSVFFLTTVRALVFLRGKKIGGRNNEHTAYIV